MNSSALLVRTLEVFPLGGSTRFLITGSRTWVDWQTIREALRLVHLHSPGAVMVNGKAYGADCLCAAMWQHAGGEVEYHVPEWKVMGPKAGTVRNFRMVESGVDLCLAFILKNSSGASQCAEYAEYRGVHTIRFEH